MDLMERKLTGLNEAQKRSRTAFFSSVLGSAIVLLLIWNLSFSWSRNLPDHDDDSWWAKEIFKEKVKPWNSRYFYTLPLLGINMTTDDIGMIGPFALLVLALYYASCETSTRRQVADVIKNFGSSHAEEIYVAIKSGMVLNSIDEDHPFENVPVNKEPVRYRITKGSIYRILIFLPALASVAAIGEDVWGAYIERELHGHAVIPTTIFQIMPWQDKIVQIAFDIVGIGMTALVIRFTLEVSRDSLLIREMVQKLGNSATANSTRPASGA